MEDCGRRRRRCRYPGIALLLLLTAPRPALAQVTGTIAGTVANGVTGAPIAGANVTILDERGITAHTTSGQRALVATDASGVYSVTGLPAATYFIEVIAGGFATQLFNGIPCPVSKCVPQSGTPVVISPAGSTATANIAMSLAGAVEATVRRASDQSPVSSGLFLLYDARGVLLITNGISDGTSGFSELPAGTYFGRVQTIPGFRTDVLEELYANVPCPAPNSVPACNVLAGTPIVISPGATTRITFDLDAGGSISGRVTAATNGAPVDGTTVAAYSAGVAVASATTDASGAYTITGVPTGVYYVRTAAPVATNVVDAWFGGPCVGCAGDRAAVAVSAGAVTPNVDFALSAGGTIAGTLRFTTPGFAILGPSVQVFSASGTLVRATEQFTAGNVFNSTGPQSFTVPYQIAGLAPGTYYVRSVNPASPPPFHIAAPVGGFLIDELFNNLTCVTADCDVTRGTPVPVTANAVTANIDFTLDVGATISGDEPPSDDNTPSPVHVYDARGVELPSRAFGTSAANVFRGYSAVGLPSGTYYVRMDRARNGQYPAALYKDIPCDACPVTTGTPIALSMGQNVSGVNFTALEPHGFSGTVTEQGSARGGVRVEVLAPDGRVVTTAVSLADGRYFVTGLSGGTYRLRTVNSIGAVDVERVASTPIASGGVVVEPTGIDLDLTPGRSVSGSITDQNGVAIDGAGVEAFTSPAVPLTPHAPANAFGRFTIDVPRSASNRLFTDPMPALVREIYDNVPCPAGVCHPLLGTPIDTTTGPVSGINFSLASCSPAPLAPLQLARAAVGIPYRQTFVASGVSSARFSIASGALPAGLVLDESTGVLSGTPTAGGSFTFTIGAATAGGCMTTRTYTLDIPACALTLSPTEFFTRARGEPFLIMLEGGCGPVPATTTDAWISIDSVTATSVLGKTLPNTAVTPRDGHIVIGSRVFTVHQNGIATTAPFGVVDTPLDGERVSGSIAVSGWALDDMVVGDVEIFRDPVPGEPGSQVFIGKATFVPGARPDVEAAFPLVVSNRRAGWGYLLLTNMLPNQGNGTFRLHAYAVDSDLQRVLLGSRTIIASNSTATAPFGAIDTPGQGETISGAAYVNWGWALTPQPKMFPLDGSTIRVFIDGAPIGPLTAYNLFRSDVSTLFPGLKNSGGPVGFRVIDTTALSEGLHTISWGVVDDAGQAAGIGSRFFAVQNSAWTPSLRIGSTIASTFDVTSRAAAPAVSSLELASAETTTAVPATVPGIDLGRRFASSRALPIDEAGAQAIAVRELQRIEMELSNVQASGFGLQASGASGDRRQDRTCAPTYEGYLVAGGELRTLPVGASLDAAGRFYWQPGAGFVGAYQLLFVKTACDGTRTRIPVDVRIGPR